MRVGKEDGGAGCMGEGEGLIGETSLDTEREEMNTSSSLTVSGFEGLRFFRCFELGSASSKGFSFCLIVL